MKHLLSLTLIFCVASVVHAAAPPMLTGVAPASGSTFGSTRILLTGSNLFEPLTVTIGGKPVRSSAANASGTQVVAVTPPGSSGAKTIVVTTSAGKVSLKDAFAYVLPPVIDAVTPSGGPPAGGTAVRITGAFLESATTVSIAGVDVAFTVEPDGSITTTTPPSSAGAKFVTVKTAGGASTKFDGFVYASNRPATAPQPAPIAPPRVSAPPPPPATTATAIPSPASNDASGPSTAVPVIAAPNLTNARPCSGSIAGGTIVVLTGTNLSNPSAVLIGSAAALVRDVNAAGTEIQIVVPPSAAPGSRDIMIATPGGQSTLKDSFIFVSPPPETKAVAVEAAAVTPTPPAPAASAPASAVPAASATAVDSMASSVAAKDTSGSASASASTAAAVTPTPPAPAASAPAPAVPAASATAAGSIASSAAAAPTETKAAPPPVISPSGPVKLLVGQQESFSVTGGTGRCSFTIISTRPVEEQGFIDSVGMYTALVPGTEKVRATDESGVVAEADVQIFPPLQIDPPFIETHPGVKESFEVTGGYGKVSVAVADNKSGGGLAMNGGGGTYTSGTAQDQATDIIRATDELGNTFDLVIVVLGKQ